MCIIVAKPAGVKMPDWDTLEECWFSNNHGAGLMYADKGLVHIRKGFMTFDDFLTEIDNMEKRFDLDALPLVMHFRISTQAGINMENTHPFPITRDEAELSATESKSEIGGLAHNGIISCCSSKKEGITQSDTLIFVRDYVARFAEMDEKLLRESWVQNVLHEVASSKLTILFPDGDIVTMGDFIIDEGVAYSNAGYLKPVYNRYTYRSGNYKPYAWDSDYSGYSDYSNYAGYGLYDKPDKSSSKASASKETEELFECSELMYYWDTESGEYVECDPDFNMYDAKGELWILDEENFEMIPTGIRVYDYNMRPVTIPRMKNPYEVA